MQELRVIGVESGALLVATEAGSEFRLPVTPSLHAQLRAASPEHSGAAHKVSPREIQSRIRNGKSADQVAELTGVDVDYVRRFEGPVLAELAFILRSARDVSVSIGGEGGVPAETSRFGDVIDARLDAAEAVGPVWRSYKDSSTGWIIHVTYTAQEVEREATWCFDPKKQSLAPLNGDAHTLSRQDNRPAPLVPRLRAVGSDATNEVARFDSGAFELKAEAPETTIEVAEPPLERVTPLERPREGRTAASTAAMNRAPEIAPSHNQTADLLEALRRRRGEREAARFDESDPLASRSDHPATGTIRVVDVPLPEHTGDSRETAAWPSVEPPRTTKPIITHPTASRAQPDPAPEQPKPPVAQRRKGRASMPSWDEIVFGARSDDDPA